MDKIVYLNLLYDFYGELLTARQRGLFELYYRENLSLSEISGQTGISRQAVSGTLHKTERKLNGLETALGLAEQHAGNNEKIDLIISLVKEQGAGSGELIGMIEELR